MNDYEDVTYDAILKDEWCELKVFGSIADRHRVELAIYEKNAKKGVTHIIQDKFIDEKSYYCDEFIPCEYDEIAFLHTAEGTYLLVTKADKQGVIALSASRNKGDNHVFYQELFPCMYDEIKYIGGYPSYFLLYEGNTVMKYNFMTRKMTLE